jgi:hypothetical protein
VLALDGLLVGTIISAHPTSRLVGLLPLMASVLTFLMVIEERKWTIRWKGRIERLKMYDRTRGFGRFYFEESGFLKFPLEYLFSALMLFVGLGLLTYAVFLFTGIQLV